MIFLLGEQAVLRKNSFPATVTHNTHYKFLNCHVFLHVYLLERIILPLIFHMMSQARA